MIRSLGSIPVALGVLVAAAASLPRLAAAAPGAPPPFVRAHVAARYFDGLSPDDPALLARVEMLELPAVVREHIERFPWERDQLARFGGDKTHCLVRAWDGRVISIVFRGERVRIERAVSEAQARVIGRLYAGGFDDRGEGGQPPQANFDLQVSRVCDRARRAASPELVPPGSVIAEALQAGRASSARELGAALLMLDVEGDADACACAIWCLARLGDGFRRRDGSMIPDKDAIDWVTLFENVSYALRARREMPWGREVSPQDFIDHVLPLRGTSEPLQRWRALFFHALAPEAAEMATLEGAVRFVNTLSAAIFTYEGNTTWEDFGVLTALGTHEGRCEDMVNFENAMHRALGIPAEHVFTPAWARGDGNHAWIGIPRAGGGIFSIMGCEPPDAPPFFQRYVGEVTAAKIYMSTPGGRIDVTARFGPTGTVTWSGVRAGTDVFLNVFNSGDWRSVGAARADAGGTVAFADVGRREDILLLPTYGQLGFGGGTPVQVAGAPAVIRSDATVVRLVDRADDPEAGWRAEVGVDRSVVRAEVAAGARYQVLAWRDGGWRVDAEVTADAEGRLAVMLERGRAHVLAAAGGARVGRPFVTETVGGEARAVGY